MSDAINVRVVDLDHVAASEPMSVLQLCRMEHLPTLADEDTLGDAKLCSYQQSEEPDGWWELTVPVRSKARGSQPQPMLRYRVRPGRVEFDTGMCWGVVDEAQVVKTAPAAYYLMRALEHALIRDLALCVLGRSEAPHSLKTGGFLGQPIQR